jgi:hypothetical protein
MMKHLALAKIEGPSEKVLREIHGLSRQDRGKIAAVEPRFGQYFLGKTLVEAAKEARRNFPGRTFYFVRVGSRTAHRHQAGPQRRKA